MLYDFLQIKEESKWKCLKLQTFLKRQLLYLKDTFLKFYFRVKSGEKWWFLSPKLAMFLYYWLVIIISVTSFNERFLLFRETEENEDRRETMEWTV